LKEIEPRSADAHSAFMAEEVMSKGNSFRSIRTLLETHSGTDDWQRILARLPPSTRELMLRPPLAMSWVPFVHSEHIFNISASVLGPRALEVWRKVGFDMLQNDLSTIYRAMMRVVSIDFVLTRAGAIFSQYVKNGGSLEATRSAAGAAIGRYRQLPLQTDAYGHFLSGSFLGALTLAGAKNARIDKVELVGPGAIDVTAVWS
jgi:hypothetical protein